MRDINRIGVLLSSIAIIAIATPSFARSPKNQRNAAAPIENPVNNPGAPKTIIGDILDGTNIKSQSSGKPDVKKPIIGDILEGTNIRKKGGVSKPKMKTKPKPKTKGKFKKKSD